MSAAAEPLRQRILEERDGAVLIVTIDCPSRKNAIAPVLRAALPKLAPLMHDASPRVRMAMAELLLCIT